MQGRDYQIECAEAVLRKLSAKENALCHLATGLGKTVIMGLVCRPINRPILIIAHLKILVEQTAKLLQRMMPNRHISIEQGENRWESNLFSNNEIIVACSQSLVGRLHKYNPSDFAFVIVDEAHHAVMSKRTYGLIHKHFQKTSWFGVTATPIRADHESLKPIFGECIFTYDVRQGIDNGWLVPVQRFPVNIQNINYEQSDGTPIEDQEFLDDNAIHQVVRPLVDVCNRKGKKRLGLVFASTVDQAERMAYATNIIQPGSAGCISGETPKPERELILNHYRIGGPIQYLYGCDCFIEGFDNTEIAVVIPKTCQHWARYCQMVGRAIRPAYGVLQDEMNREQRLEAIRQSRKPSCVILDIYGLGSKHSLMQPEEIHKELVKTYPEFREKKIGEEPKAVAFDEETYPIYQILENERIRAAQMRRLRQTPVQVRYEVSTSSAFECDEGEMAKTPRKRKRITQTQIDKIRKLQKYLNINTRIDPTMLHADATVYIEQLIQQRESGPPSKSMIAFLEKRHWNWEGMTWLEAKKMIEEFKLVEE